MSKAKDEIRAVLAALTPEEAEALRARFQLDRDPAGEKNDTELHAIALQLAALKNKKR
jgi:DNA-directed RNA polymerase sigma subunit (sigma70/sigma32)